MAYKPGSDAPLIVLYLNVETNFMELSNEQVQKIAAAVIRQLGAVPLVSAGAEAFPGGAGWRQQPPEFYGAGARSPNR